MKEDAGTPWVLSINTGSSSVKVGLYRGPVPERVQETALAWGSAPGSPKEAGSTLPSVGKALTMAWEQIQTVTGVNPSTLAAVGHRVVYGGSGMTASQPVTSKVLRGIQDGLAVAPLHNRTALEGIAWATRELPQARQVAVFATGFHATLPAVSFLFAVPFEWYRHWGIRRLGFHGISNRYCLERAATLLDQPPTHLNLVVCHLGSGSSVTAIRTGQSVSNSMGMTPLDGLMMGTRCGRVDPGALLYLLRQGLLTPDAMAEQLEHRSGLLGISGLSGDLREVLAAADGGHERAALAVNMYALRVAQEIAAAVVLLPRMDALVFTGGVGEHAAGIRRQVATALTPLGIALVPEEETAIGAAGSDRDIATEASRSRVLVIPSRENDIIARDALQQEQAIGF